MPSRKLQVAAPLVLGAGLVALFLYLLLSYAPAPEPAPPEPPPPVAVVPQMPPAEQEPLPPPARIEGPAPAPALGKGEERWGIEPPAGWDPALAGMIADYFARMHLTPDFSDPENLKQAENLEAVREALREFLVSLGPEALPTLSAILNAEPDFVNRRFLLYAIGELGPRSEDTTFVLLDFYNNRRTQQGARSESNHVIEAMGRLKNESSYQAMTQLIDDPATEYYDRDKFIQALGEHPRRQDSIPRFVAYGRDDEDDGVRNHSWQALGKMGSAGRDALPDCISAYQRETTLHVRQTILGTIGKIGDPEALPFLEREARTAEPKGVRLSAANAIKLIGTPEAVETLQSVADGERESEVRDRIRGWLAKSR